MLGGPRAHLGAPNGQLVLACQLRNKYGRVQDQQDVCHTPLGSAKVTRIALATSLWRPPALTALSRTFAAPGKGRQCHNSLRRTPFFLLPALPLLAKGAAPAAARHAAGPDTAANRLACWRLQPRRRHCSESCKPWSRACMQARRGCLADHLTGSILGQQGWTAWVWPQPGKKQPKPSRGNFKLVLNCRSAPKTFPKTSKRAPPKLRKSKQKRLMKLVLISLEFTAGTFSGNGVYAANQVFSAGSTCLHAPWPMPHPSPYVQRSMASAGPRSGTLGARGTGDRRNPGSSQQSKRCTRSSLPPGGACFILAVSMSA